MANPDRARKLLVRSALAAGATAATFIGAQNLAMLDVTQFSLSQTPSNVASPMQAITATVIQQGTPEIAIQQAAPSIVILRESGQQSAQQVANTGANTASQTTMVIQPPVPSEIQAPAPVVIQQPGAIVQMQQPVPQVSRSSR